MAKSVTMRVNKHRLFVALRGTVPDIKEEVLKAGRKSADELAEKMRETAPERDGDLKKSIVVTKGGHRTPSYSYPGGSVMVPEGAHAVTVGNTDVRYGHLVEYGSSKAPAQPFFWPTYRLLKRRILGRFSRAMSKAIRRRFG